MSVVRVHGPSPSKTHAICALAGTGSTLYAIGGAGENYALSSTDGATFKLLEAPGRGLREILVDGKAIWLAGELGHLYYSAAGFTNFRKLNLKTNVCLFGLAKAPDGSIWVSGEQGVLARSTGRRVFTRVRGVTGNLGRLTATDEGVYIPSTEGLWIARGGEVTKLGIDKPLGQVLRTRLGTILVVGTHNSIYRSSDGGKTFTAAKMPAFTPVDAAYPSDWVPTGEDFSVIVQASNDRLIAGGDRGVIVTSIDDGRTFQRVEHDLIGGSLWAAGTWNGLTLLGGERAIILRVDRF